MSRWGAHAVRLPGERPWFRERVVRLVSIAVCGALPALTVAVLFATAFQEDSIAFDFRPFYGAAQAVLDGVSPYPSADASLNAAAGPYVYPPLGALAAVPLTLLPRDIAGLIVMGVLVAAALATLRVLQVRDWRCYGIALLWPPILSAIQTGNVTLLLALAAALVWRFRDGRWLTAAFVGVTLALKFFPWPLLVWLAATRRTASAVLGGVIGGGLVALSWAAIGFAGLVDYPDLLQRLEDTVGADSYTVYIAALDAGAPPGLARGIWLVVGLVILAAMVLVARRGDERSSFLLAIAASLSLTPIVWLHYFALLLVVVAIAQPRMGPIWFVPFAMVLTPGSGHPTPFETSWTLAVAALTFGMAIRASRLEAGGARVVTAGSSAAGLTSG